MKTSPEMELLPEKRSWNLATAIALGAVATVAAVAWSSLLLAELGHHTLRGVVALVGLLVGAAGLALRWGRRRGRAALVAPLRVDPGAERRLLLAAIAVAAAAAWMFLPGFPFALADRDPGVYLAQAFQISRTGDVALEDPVVAPDSGLAWASALGWRQGEMRFPGFVAVDRQGERVVPQFYALYPSLLATLLGGGTNGAVAVNPLLAALAAVLLFLLTRAAAGSLAGALAALLFVSQMIQVWAAKYPTAEILAQLFVLGSALALAAAIERRSTALGALAGALLALTFLARPDGILVVALAAAGGLLWAWFGLPGAAGRGLLGGFLALAPHAFVQAYHPLFNLGYTRRSGLPGPGWVALAGVLFLLALRLAVRAGGEGDRRWQPSPAARRVLAFAALGVTTLWLTLAGVRPWIFGEDVADGRRTFNEESLWRLGWFFTPRGLLLLWLGVVFVFLTSLRARPATRLLLAPALSLLPVYLYDPRIDPGLMWWTRRFVPFTLPGMTALVAIGLAGLWAWSRGGAPTGRRETVRGPRPRIRLALSLAVVALAGDLILAWLGMSLPLRRHHEMHGTLELIDELGHLSPGRHSVLLWYSERHVHSPGYCFAGPVWAYFGEVSALLPFDVTADEMIQWAAAYPDSPIFLVADDAPPPALSSLPFVLARRFDVVLPMWKESTTERPAGSRRRRFAFKIWRFDRGIEETEPPS